MTVPFRDANGRLRGEGGKFLPDPNLQGDLNRDQQIRKALLRVAQRIAKIARDDAREFERTGDYRKSIRVNPDADTVRVESTDPFAHLVEFGSINNEAYAPLRRAAAQVGRLRENPK